MLLGFVNEKPPRLQFLHPSGADYGQSNTIILVGMPRGQHKVLIELVDAEGNVFTGQTVTFDSPGKEVRHFALPVTDSTDNFRGGKHKGASVCRTNFERAPDPRSCLWGAERLQP